MTVLTAVLRFPKNLHVKIEASAKPSPIAYSCVPRFLYSGDSRFANVSHHTRLVALTDSHHLFGAREINQPDLRKTGKLWQESTLITSVRHSITIDSVNKVD